MLRVYARGLGGSSAPTWLCPHARALIALWDSQELEREGRGIRHQAIS